MKPSRIAFICDIHANLPALDAVLADIDARGVSRIWHIGDLVGHGPQPEEVVRRLMKRRIRGVAGNLDVRVRSIPTRGPQWWRTKPALKILAWQWAWQNLSPGGRRYLRALPMERRLAVAGHRILLTHSSPASSKEYISLDTPQSRLVELAAVADADVVVVGHSHEAFLRKAGGTLFVNGGSVGRFPAEAPTATYALLTVTPEVEAEIIRVPYDIQPLLEALARAGLPNEFRRLFTGL